MWRLASCCEGCLGANLMAGYHTKTLPPDVQFRGTGTPPGHPAIYKNPETLTFDLDSKRRFRASRIQ